MAELKIRLLSQQVHIFRSPEAPFWMLHGKWIVNGESDTIPDAFGRQIGLVQSMAFNLFDHPIVTMMPEHVPGAWAWSEHVPFAFLAMELARPRCFVELGTHSGMSYCAFCQAVDRLRLPTRCFAIDTWQGDAHAGKYEQILPALREYHDQKYGSFSRLVQSTFDQAADGFADGSIDLLHIDGLHTFEAVKHDYETWRPKLSDAGIVLFHDTNVTDRDFGVYKLWRELEKKSPGFEFKHCWGLGVLGVGRAVPEKFLEFLEAARREPEKMREFFEALGGRISGASRQTTLTRIFFDQQKLMNDWKRKIGAKVDPQSENLEEALEKSVEYAVGCAREVNELIEDNLKLRAFLGSRGH